MNKENYPEVKMIKKLSLLVILLIVATMMCADVLVSIRTTDLNTALQGQNLRQNVWKLSQQGCSIYHYNADYVVSGTTDAFLNLHPEYKAQRLASLPILDNVYQVSKLPTETTLQLDGFATLLQDMGETVLIESPLSDLRLRAQIRNSFFQYDFVPMTITPEFKANIPIVQNRTPIDDMISQVNADSVLWFIQNLQDFQTRYAQAPNRLQVATWIRDQFIRMGITNATLSPFQWQGTTQYNVVATITGSINPDQYIVVGGHHDSILNSGDPLIFAPGADDNASGAVAALEMARVMMASNFVPQSSIRFVTFAAEEFGLWGSKDYATSAYTTQQNILLMINHDMIANSTQTPADWQVRLMPYDGFWDFSNHAADLTSAYTTLNPTFGTVNSASSDSHSFWTKGFPVIYFFEQVFCPYYHSVNDITANLNPVYCAEVIRASTAIAATYSYNPSAPASMVVQDTGNGSSLKITWPNVVASNVDHYVIYHAEYDSGVLGDPVNVPATAGATTTYILNNLTSNMHYILALATVSTAGYQSNFVYSQGTPNVLPITPLNYVVTPNLGNVALTWDANTEVDLAGYKVFRSTEAHELGTQLGNGLQSTNIFTDSQFPNPIQYYYYTICAVDTDGNQSAYSTAIRSRPVTLNQGILVIDETLNGNGTSPFTPNDEQVDTFYSGLLTHFTTTNLDTEVSSSLRLCDIGIYSSILWHANDQVQMNLLHEYRDDLKRYIELGGNVLLDAYMPSMEIELNAGYPVTFNANTVVNSGFGIASAAYNAAARFKYAEPIANYYPLLTVDPLKTTSSFNGHIFKVESITANSNAQNIYTYGSDYEDNSNQGAMNGAPVGVYYNHQPGKVITLSFPLYNMTTDSVQNLFNHIFRYVFDEPSPTDDPTLVTSPQITIYPTTPNPFSTTTNIRIDYADTKGPVKVAIYNLKGQLVQTLYSGILTQSKTAVDWNGTDSAGTTCATGIYFIRVSQNGSSSIRKIMKIK